MRTLIFGTIAVLCFVSCSPYKEVELTDITNVELLSMDARTVALRVDARIDNPNGFTIAVEEPDVDLFLNDKYIGKGLLDSALVLDRKTAKVYPVYLHADLEAGPLIGMLITSALIGQVKVGVKGTVSGRSGAFRKRFPFEMEEVIDLRD
ncbi:MAG: LEA type 2 family protein [Flavobacteriales bacterium]|nr:LEA type 2 family protein [Flavobacteriales bacterium]MCC6938068.1 LEA type 2 family protein [Flavobacteriales bacterium]